MSIRKQFDLELQALKNELVKMAESSRSQLEHAVKSLYERDVELAEQVMKEDEKIDELDLAINEAAILLIAKQQPVATDLRKLIVAIRISTDIERMADNAKNIARSTIHLGEDHQLEIDSSLKDMCDVAYEMVDLAIKSYRDEDYKLAKKLSELDDSIDRIFGQVLARQLTMSATNPQKIQLIMQVAYVARYIERFGDHLTNIAESILYLVKGENRDLNE
ncbi:phosphate signaling complex protein PhoU [Amphibacillus sp. MSJ-3]|uniref:phosphate signaling complex protein PhoU n=1 Tax=Amphibacillus sp. MSJ-3 TaxID=2841505 RepID=UPI001C0F0BB7|nr:phosphate signaling complex protein PhoU [Amphibacillus sp. MSJ-3]MBU5593560.1 phosphate signaling complex protein PhoU [Amphibacillus sp. MSJ-3]